MSDSLIWYRKNIFYGKQQEPQTGILYHGSSECLNHNVLEISLFGRTLTVYLPNFIKPFKESFDKVTGKRVYGVMFDKPTAALKLHYGNLNYGTEVDSWGIPVKLIRPKVKSLYLKRFK